MIPLPEAFVRRMEAMLGGEAKAFFASYEQPRQYGLRVNTGRIRPEEFAEKAPFPVASVPWVENGFYYPEDVRPTRHPYYDAGLYYLQEPSAMTPASRLPVEKGERVLDLCAAPGGKATELAVRLGGRGTLVANDISNSRAKALLHNLELFGVPNLFVTNEIPGRLADSFAGWFDKVLVDAPCSGEGMFRKSPEVIKTWDEERSEYFVRLQRDIVSNAAVMLRPGGMMMYSTCTFAPRENEGTVAWLLDHCPEMELVEMEPYAGFRPGVPAWGEGSDELKKCVHIWPHCMEGEGHFLALLKKKETEEQWEPPLLEPAKTNKQERALLTLFLKETGITLDQSWVESRGGKAYLMPELPAAVKGLHFLRCGLYLGEFKKKRFEPSQSFAMALSTDTCREVLGLPKEDARVVRYLRGETIQAEEFGENRQNGWKLVCVERFPLGWGKLLNGVVKNKFLCAWRKN